MKIYTYVAAYYILTTQLPLRKWKIYRNNGELEKKKKKTKGNEIKVRA